MSPAIVLTAAAAVLVSAFTKSRRRNRSVRKVYTGRDSFAVMANNLKAATKKVDNSAVRVEDALKPLMAA